MKKNVLLKLLAPSAIAFAGVLAVSCSKNVEQQLPEENPNPNPDQNPNPNPDPTPNPEPNPNPTPDPEPAPKPEPEKPLKIKMPFNYYIEEADQTMKIFDEKKWDGKSFSDEINAEFIKSTIISNDKYDVEIKEEQNWIIKNEDLKFVSFLYKYNKKNNESSDVAKKKQWSLQTIYFDNSDDTSLTETSMTIDEYWSLAKEAGDSNNLGNSPYKDSFYDSSLINITPKYTSITQAGIYYITIPYFVAKDKFDEINKKYSILVRYFAGEGSNYNESSEHIWQTQLATKNGNDLIELAKIQYLKEGLQIWRVTKNENTYLKFKFPKNSIKVTLTAEKTEYLSDFENEFYINISKWKKTSTK